MKRHIISALILLGTISLMAGCKSKPSTTETGNNSTNSMSSEGENEMGKNDTVKIDDLLSLTDWLGKTDKELNLDAAGASGKYMSFDVEGTFLGKKAQGSVGFEKSEDDYHVYRVSFTASKSSLEEFYAQLIDTYGGPVDKGTEPYAKANGGAVDWFVFDAGNALVKISQGSLVDYVSVEYSQNTNPSDAGKLVIRKVAETESSYSGYDMVLRALSYENGILTVSITNQTDETITYTDDYVLAKSADDGNTYAHLNRMDDDLGFADAQEYEIAAGQTQEMECDLRIFGKIESGKYMLILDDMQAEFQLIPEDEDTGEAVSAPWFCPECGTKNSDGSICKSCGTKKE